MARKKGEGAWGKKIINGVEYDYFRKKYNGIDKTFYGRSIAEVKEKKSKFELSNSLLPSKEIKKLTLGEYMENWLVTKRYYEVEKSTYKRNKSTFVNNIRGSIPYNTQLNSINSEIIQKHIDSLSERLSRSTVNKIKFLYNLCLSDAKEKGNISYNPMANVKVKKEKLFTVKKKEIPFLEEDDIEKLFKIADLRNTKSNRIRGAIGTRIYGDNAWIVIFILYTGLRIGEVLALKWKNVDFKNKMLKVDTNLAFGEDLEGNNIKYEKDTKEKEEVRYVPLCDRAIYSLQQFKSYDKHKGNDKVVNVSDASNVRRTLQSMINRAECDVEHCSLHALRHSYGSLLLSQGVDLKTISVLLGHQDITTTANIYVKVTNKLKIDSVNVLNKMNKNKDSEK